MKNQVVRKSAVFLALATVTAMAAGCTTETNGETPTGVESTDEALSSTSAPVS